MANKNIILKDKEILIEKTVEKGLSYRQLAKEVGVSQTTISLIINGERNPSPKTAISICNVLRCQFDDIFFIQSDYKSNRKIITTNATNRIRRWNKCK